MKRIFAIILSVVFCLAAVSISSSAQQTERVVKVGYFNYDGFSMPDGEGGIIGFEADYLDEIVSYTGWNYEYISGTVEECLERLETGEIDLVGGFQYTEERGERFLYSKYEIGTEYAVLLVKEENKEVYYGDAPTFDGMNIGFIQGTYQIEALRQYAREKDFRYTESFYETVPELMAAIEQEDIDAIAIGSLQRNDNLQAVAKFMPIPFYFITAKDKTDICTSLNEAMENIQTSDMGFSLKLYNKYYAESAARQTAFTREEQQYITEHPVLRVVYNDDWYPVEYFDRDTKSNAGIAAGIMELLSERSGIDFEYIKASSEEEALKKLQKGEADLIGQFPFDYPDTARKNNLYVTKPYYEVPVMLAALDGTTAADIKAIAIPGNMRTLYRCAKELYPGQNFILMRDAGECVRAVQNGTVDAVFENSYVLEQYFKGENAIAPHPIISTKSTIPIGLGLPGDSDPALKTLFNKLIVQLSAERINGVVLKETIGTSRFDIWLLWRAVALPFMIAAFVIILALTLRSRKKIENYAFKDPLTGYMNKTKFMLAAQKHLWNKDSSGYAAVSLDIDKFKLINSMHGFDVGNRILKEISEIMCEEMKSGELFCRESDDRFRLLLKMHSPAELKLRLERIIEEVAKIPQKLGAGFQYTISCGVYRMEKNDKDIYAAAEFANMARGEAKQHRQNWISWYGEAMRQTVVEEQEIENKMELALLRKEFLVVYQPKIFLENGKLAGAEALVRWRLKNGECIYPERFVPVFESNGFILKLDIYVFEQVCRQMSLWIRRGFEPCPISVNLSRVHLDEPEFYKKYIDVLRNYNIPPSLMEIELTESMVFGNVAMMDKVVSEFRKAGLKVSIDDFGSGYSSLNLLKDLTFDSLKLDREFLNSAAMTERGKHVIKGTKYLADHLGMLLVAEGVETEDQVAFLKELGCDMAQGYYFSKPVEPAEFERFAGWGL